MVRTFKQFIGLYQRHWICQFNDRLICTRQLPNKSKIMQLQDKTQAESAMQTHSVR